MDRLLSNVCHLSCECIQTLLPLHRDSAYTLSGVFFTNDKAYRQFWERPGHFQKCLQTHSYSAHLLTSLIKKTQQFISPFWLCGLYLHEANLHLFVLKLAFLEDKSNNKGQVKKVGKEGKAGSSQAASPSTVGLAEAEGAHSSLLLSACCCCSFVWCHWVAVQLQKNAV